MASQLFTLLVVACSLVSVLGDWKAPKFCNGLECPEYSIIKTEKEYEVRRYKASKWVVTSLQGIDHNIARSVMFRRLFDYISGLNEGSKKIDMTAPVLTKVYKKGELNFTMGFFIAPSEAKNAPKPSDPDVHIAELPEQTVYIRAFPGYADMEDHIRVRGELVDALPKDVKYDESYYFMAGYDSPYKPFDRHNEAWLVAV